VFENQKHFTCDVGFPALAAASQKDAQLGHFASWCSVASTVQFLIYQVILAVYVVTLHAKKKMQIFTCRGILGFVSM